MWVADKYDQMVYAYSMSTGERLPHKEITSLGDSGNRDARGIWSDAQTMWVADGQNDKIYAYPMISGDKASTPVPMTKLEPWKPSLRTG